MAKAPHKNKLDRAHVGDVIGYLTLLRRVRKPEGVYGDIWRVRCVCGLELTVPEQYMFRPKHPRHHCGCQNKTNKTIYKREYGIWKMMHRRCYFPSHVSYEYYGKLGVSVCDRWREYGPSGDSAFNNFLADVGPATTSTHTLDRYPNPAGNYEPGNVRWATAEQQGLNKRHSKKPTTG